jgi:uncharacterized membrane protein YgdD (TMEM256/DUF423 family)
MSTRETRARSEMRRMLAWIALLGVLMVAGSLWYISLFGPLNVVNVCATVGGVFLSMLLGCGLFALAFYSSKSGHDEASRDATDHHRP